MSTLSKKANIHTASYKSHAVTMRFEFWALGFYEKPPDDIYKREIPEYTLPNHPNPDFDVVSRFLVHVILHFERGLVDVAKPATACS